MVSESSAVLRHDEQGRPVYRAGRAPEGLVTAAQLRARRLSPAGLTPVAWLYFARIGHQVCPLYDPQQARPIRELTAGQRQVLAAGRALANTVPCTGCGRERVEARGARVCDACRAQQAQQAAQAHEQRLAGDRDAAAQWAAEALADPGLVVLDTETTGLLGGVDPVFVVEIAVLDGQGTVLLETLVHPQEPIPSSATDIHGITDEMVSAAPTFSALLPQLTRVLAGRRVVIYNAAFDCGVLGVELDRHFRAAEPEAAPSARWHTHPSTRRWLGALRTECAMQRYAEWFGDWNSYYRSYTWQALGGGHRAAGDCAATLTRMQQMAQTAEGGVGGGNQPRPPVVTSGEQVIT